MILNLEQIKAVTSGTENIFIENGRFCFHRFSAEEAKVINNPNLLYTSGVQMEFKTDGNLLKLKVDTKEKNGIRSYFAFDIFENGLKIGNVQNFDEELSGNYANQKYGLGEYEGKFSLRVGDKVIKIVFPHSVIAEIEEIELLNATYILPIIKQKNIIFYGDSITQGYDSLHPSNTYAYRLSDTLNATLKNKALGGAIFSPKLVNVKNDYNPDYIVVAYGTNDWNRSSKTEFINAVSEFLDNLRNNYPYSPVYIISPIWRKDFNNYTKFGSFFELEKTIKKLCDGKTDITFISGFDLVPHKEECFGDLKIHPSDCGFKHYFDNLIKFIS